MIGPSLPYSLPTTRIETVSIVAAATAATNANTTTGTDGGGGT